MRDLRIGVIGYGNMGTSYAKWLVEGKVPGAVLSSVCDAAPAKRAAAKEALPASIAIFDDSKKLIRSGTADAVIIAVPHYHHPEMAIDALEQGLHVVVDKPAGVYTKQIRRMNEVAASRPGQVFAMMFNQRTNPLYQRVQEIVASGRLGGIRRVTWFITSWWRTQKYYDSSAWRATWAGEGGGVLVNQAPHQLDLLQWIGGMPSRVQGFLKFGSHRDITVEDDVTAYLEYPNGATGVFVTCVHDAMGTDRFEIHCDNGKIIVDNSTSATVKILRKPEEQLNRELDFRQMLAIVRGEGGEKLYDEEHFEFPERWDIQHIDILVNFTQAVREGKPLIAPGVDGIRAVEIANAMHLSSWLGKTVELPVDEDLFFAELSKRIQEERRGENL